MSARWRIVVAGLAVMTLGLSLTACSRQAGATHPTSTPTSTSLDAQRQALKHYVLAFNGFKDTVKHWIKAEKRAKASQAAREEPSATATKLEAAAQRTGECCAAVAALQPPARLRVAHRRLLGAMKGLQGLYDDLAWLYRDASHGVPPANNAEKRLMKRARAVIHEARAWESAVKREMKRLGMKEHVRFAPADSAAAA